MSKMTTTTLRGVFPEPKPVPTRNFIKENMKQIKRMQGLVQESGVGLKRQAKDARPEKAISQIDATGKHKTKPNLNKGLSQTGSLPGSKIKAAAVKSITQSTKKSESSKIRESKISDKKIVEEKIINIGIQTEQDNDLNKIFEDGTIMYPSPSVLQEINAKKMIKRRKAFGNDRSRNNSFNANQQQQLTEQIQNLNVGDKKSKQDSNPSKVPLNYQRGVLPKYLKQRKEEQLAKDSSEGDTECPPGHVLLPEEERKETLRVLRESYAERIQELNVMPVRNDTLKMRKRKIAIEEELKKIDEGIKVFQRPKVFVKINA